MIHTPVSPLLFYMREILCDLHILFIRSLFPTIDIKLYFVFRIFKIILTHCNNSSNNEVLLNVLTPRARYLLLERERYYVAFKVFPEDFTYQLYKCLKYKKVEII